MLTRGSRVRLVFNSYALPKGSEGEIVGYYHREGSMMYVVRFPSEEQVLSAHNVELVERAPPRLPGSSSL